MSLNAAPRLRAIAGSDTATMLESSRIMKETPAQDSSSRKRLPVSQPGPASGFTIASMRAPLRAAAGNPRHLTGTTHPAGV